MTYFPVQPRYSVYVDSLGDPLDDGYIYLGKANLDPTVYPAKASWDEAGLYPITFPVRTMNGYPLRDGIPAQMYLNFADNTEYSVLISDEDGVEVFSSTTGLIGYFPSTGAGGDADTLNGLASDTAATPDTIAARDSSGDIAANAFESTVATGTAPLTVASTTLVSNLNADLLDGVHNSAMAHLAGAEIFTGQKTFNATINLATDIFSYWGSGSSTNYIRLGHTSSTGDFKMTPYLASAAQSARVFWFNGTAQEWQIDSINQYAVYHEGTSSASGSFTTSDAKTVTVVNGLITSIV